jgi:transcriptional regulator
MYIPRFNQVTDRAILIEAMRANPFAILFGPLTGQDDAHPALATHLPLVIKDEGEHGVIEGHFARANSHWSLLDGRETLVVFSGPHSYVSPSLYAERQSVPTWNYIAIHACGILTAIHAESAKAALLHDLIQANEPAYADQWLSLPDDYRRGMMKGIVGFQIPIARIEGKFKISQNRPEADRRNIRAAQSTGTPDQRTLASWMERFGL